MVKFLVFVSLLQGSWLTYAKTLKSVAIAPQGAVIVVGTSAQYKVTCTYSDSSTDNCGAAGGATWTTPTNALTVTSEGVATWNVSYDPHNATYFPNGPQTAIGIVAVTAGGLSDQGQLLAQSAADTFMIYTTPASNIYTDNQTGAALPINVVVGSTVTIGAGFTNNHVQSGQSGNPFQFACNWSSSNTAVATVSRYGLATAVAPGSVTIKCGVAGDGVYATKNSGGYSPTDTFTFNVVAPTPTSQTWYVRPDGGTPYVNRQTTPSGQCNGKYNVSYASTGGRGVNQNCAMGNLRYLWTDEVTANYERWMIGPGDTVIVAQNSKGYNLGKDARGVDKGGSTTLPINCGNSAQCYMPTIPSGTAAQHTKILGANYANCHDDSAKSQLNVSWSSQNGFSTKDSQFVDVACFVVTQQAQCGGSGSYTNVCTNANNFGGTGIIESALTASVTYTDIFIHGLSNQGIFGATGAGVSANYLHIRGVPLAGINMDDAPWLFGNMSVAGGFTMTNSITEFVGCVEENPVVHNYPYIECRDSETGGYGDGFGTASTTGNWSFDHDIWRYNFQDGLDLLHSGLQSLTVTNSSSYGNDGQAYKIGSADTVIFQNNIAVENCRRIGSVIGDEPASAVIQGVNLCRADGNWVNLEFSPYGTYTLQNNTFVGYGDVALGYTCGPGADRCATAKTTLQNNLFLGYSNRAYADGQKPALFCASVDGNCNHNLSQFPANQGWAIRDHNLYFSFRTGCPTPRTTGEICVEPHFIREPSLSMTSESAMEALAFYPSSDSSAKGAGIAIPGLLLDYAGKVRPNPPSIGAFEYASGDKSTSEAPKKDTLFIVLWIRFLAWIRQVACRCCSLVDRSIRYLWGSAKIWTHSFRRS
jgi:Bacterial Ig-like domain (group 2)